MNIKKTEKISLVGIRLYSHKKKTDKERKKKGRGKGRRREKDHALQRAACSKLPDLGSRAVSRWLSRVTSTVKQFL